MLGISIGVDLGTSTLLIYVKNKGIVLTEPTVAAYDRRSGKLLAAGKKAYEMIGRNPDSIRVVRPMKDGVISDFTATQNILRYYLQKICGNMVFKPNVMICLPSTVTNLEKRTILDLAISSGAGKACLVEEPLAAAVGAGVEINRPKGTLVIDIGGGTTEVAVISTGGVVISRSLRVAGDELDQDEAASHFRPTLSSAPASSSPLSSSAAMSVPASRAA